MSFQSQVYECSAANASVKISNNDWINEFSDGITLEPGDTVRVLGSFIQERGGGDTIEVPEDISFNISFNPYVTAETIKFHLATAGEDTQLNLGMFAQPAYATDNLGVEPPEMPGYVGTGDFNVDTLAKAVGEPLDVLGAQAAFNLVLRAARACAPARLLAHKRPSAQRPPRALHVERRQHTRDLVPVPQLERARAI